MDRDFVQPLVAVVISAAIATRSYRKKSLDLSGAISGFSVMTIHIATNYRYFFSSILEIFIHNLCVNVLNPFFLLLVLMQKSRFGAVLLVFFFSSSIFTNFGEDKKKKVDADFKEGGQRNWIQVLFNSGIATTLVMIAWKHGGSQDYCLNSKESSLMTSLIGGIIGHYCCCNGDTWSSELGVLSDKQPRLITNLKPVQRGTNGGVTKAGLLAAAAGGSVLGLTFVILGFVTTNCSFNIALKQLLLIPVSALAGLCGSVIDSLLGATLQYSGFCSVRNKVVGKPGPTVKKISGLSILDNNAVNLVSVMLTTALTSIACSYIF